MLSTENIGLKKPGYNDEADIAVVNENMDVIDAELSNRYPKSQTYSNRETDEAIATAINALPRGLIYRGAVDYYNNLPSENNELGDTYSIKYQGTSGTETDGNEYAWGEYDGTLQWIKLGVNAYTKNEIDEQHEVIKSDILSAEKAIEINQRSIGIQVSKNLIPQEVEMGFYDDTTGASMSGGSLIRVIGYAKVKPNTEYTISSNLNLFTIWNFNGNVAINRTENIKNNVYTITTPANCDNLRISLASPNVNVSDFEWIQVEEGAVATEYEPYVPSVNERLVEVEKSVIPYSEIPSTSTDEQLSALRPPAIIHTYFNANVFPDKMEGWGTVIVTSRGGSCTQTVFRNDGCILVRGCNTDGVFSSWHKFTGTALSQT